MTTNAPTLQPGNPLIPEGLNDGFRAPDLGWVGTPADAEVDVGLLECGDLVASNWWAGSIADAKALAASLVEDLRAYLAEMDGDDDETPAVVVGYWEHADTGLALVGMVWTTQEYYLFDGIPPSLARSEPLMQPLRWLSNDGDDNSPYQLVYGVAELPEEEREAFLALVLSATPEAERGGVREVYEEHYAGR